MKKILLSLILLASASVITILPSAKVLGSSAQNNGSMKYLEYSSEAFKNAPENIRAICFLADWCGYCKKVDAEIASSIKRIPKDTIIFKADFEKEGDLKRQYSINIRHECVILDRSGNIISRVSPENIVSALVLQ